MRLSREKTVRLSHVVTDFLVASDDVEFVEDRATIRQNIVDILTALLKEEEQVDAQVRQKITSQKKEILEGSEEWEVLYRRYYAEELRRMGIVHQPSERSQPRAARRVLFGPDTETKQKGRQPWLAPFLFVCLWNRDYCLTWIVPPFQLRPVRILSRASVVPPVVWPLWPPAVVGLTLGARAQRRPVGLLLLQLAAIFAGAASGPSRCRIQTCVMMYWSRAGKIVPIVFCTFCTRSAVGGCVLKTVGTVPGRRFSSACTFSKKLTKALGS